MTLSSISQLDKHLASSPLPAGWLSDTRTFWSPIDDVHGALKDLVSSATISLVIAMFGFDDDELAQIIHSKIEVPGLFVQLSLDSSQAAGTHEKALLAKQNYPATSVAYGRSEHGAIMHLKTVVVDGLYVATGSTNWSMNAETKQDNQLTITSDFLSCAQARARMDAIHDGMLKQMVRHL